jgi:membrane protease YdiL (CAAX protease family)
MAVVQLDRRRAWWLGATLVVAALAAVNVLNNGVLAPAYLIARPVEALVLVGLAMLAGLGWADLGLGRGTWARGMCWAGVAIAVIALGYAVALAVPAVRPAFLDHRADFTVGVALVQATFPVMLGTVILEELAFRGVLWGLLCRLRGPATATVVSSALFGLWHVLPTLGLTGNNAAAGLVFGAGPGANLVAVVFGVVSTTLAGVIFCELRRRSGSLLAPIGLHWATNGLGYVFAAIAWTL